MFGFGKRKPEPEKPTRRSAESRERKSQNLAQLGFLAGVGDDGDIDNLMGNMDVGDDDLEEELAMLLEGKQSAVRRPKTSPAKKSGSTGKTKGVGVANPINFNIENEEEIEDTDEGDIDLDDPELEAELGNILGVPTASKVTSKDALSDDEEDSEEASVSAPSMSKDQLLNLLQERLLLYENAKRASDSVGDSAKSRRFTRGIKTLKELLSKAKAGRVVDEADIPPIVSIGAIKKEKEAPQPQLEVPPSQSVEPHMPVTDIRESVPEPKPFNDVPAHVSPMDDDASTQLPPPLVPTPAYSPALVPEQLPVDPKPADSNEKCDRLETDVSSRGVDPIVEARLKDYKRIAVGYKRQGNVQEALKYLKLSKQLENAIKNCENISINDYPNVDDVLTKEQESREKNEATPTSAPELQPQSIPVVEASENVDPTPSNAVVPPSEDIFGAPPPPKTVMEALEQRLNKYKSEVEKANAASNSSKARRMGRIVKQYEEAISLYRKGKPVAFDELPTPPGFAPIPVGGASSVPNPAPTATASQATAQPEPPPPGSGQSSTPEKKPKTDLPMGGSGSSPGASSNVISRGGKPATKLTLQEKQLQTIKLRQQQFKEAALNAKKRGDLNQAREFLRTAKGFDKLIQVAQAGLPVDMATLPAPPEAVAALDQMEDDNFEVVSASDCIMPSGKAADVYSKLETDLKEQIKMCMRTRDHFKSIGDVASANRFESMALQSKKDLDTLRLAMRSNSDIPKYHYENRIFSITECNTDIGEDEIEISIIQGVNYKVNNPSDVDTYVKIELPYPSAEEVQTNKTSVIKDTNNPVYNTTYKMSINRTARNFQRFVHRHGFKCEVWSKGGLCSGGFFFCKCNRGFLRGNTLIGTASVKLLPLETKCTLHDAFDILDGRKAVGKLEVKVRIREPVLTKQITQKKEKWLSIDRA